MAIEPHREPLRRVLLRNGLISVAVGMAIAGASGRFGRWPPFAIAALWPTLGGHWLEVWFLNWLRPRLPESRAAQALARLVVWFIGGAFFVIAMHHTLLFLTRFHSSRWPAWWLGGAAFIAIELTVHFISYVRCRPSFWNGKG